MQKLQKILEEINAEFDRRIGIQLKIMAGLGDDVYRYGYGKSLEAYQQGKLLVTEIISKHMNDINYSYITSKNIKSIPTASEKFLQDCKKVTGKYKRNNDGWTPGAA